LHTRRTNDMKDEILEEVWTAKQEVSEQYKGDFKSFVESIKRQAMQIRERIEKFSVNPEQDAGGQRLPLSR